MTTTTSAAGSTSAHATTSVGDATSAAATFDDLDDPTDALISQLTGLFDVEPELAVVLERKLRQRATGAYEPASLEQLVGGVEALLADRGPARFEITDARWFTGGASKLQMGFTLHGEDSERGTFSDRLMVRMDPAEALNSTSKRREFQLLTLMQDTVPVPRVEWVDADARFFPYPALVYSIVDGVTKPQNADTGRVSGLGTNFGEDLRAKLRGQFIRQLAAIHTFDAFDGAELGALSIPEAGTTQAARWKLDAVRRVWEEDRLEDVPLVEVAFNWMGRELPVLDKPSVVHGDYRSGNFLFDEESAQITAWLDWELGYIGDRHLDLAWATNPMFGHWSEDGSHYFVSGLMTPDEFFDAYREASGLGVDPDTLRWYRVLNACDVLAKVLATGRRVVRLGKTHQDILLARVEGMIPGVMLELQGLLEEVL